MYFNETEMLKICEKYGIEVVEKEGRPMYMGKEMGENFSIEMMMKEPLGIENITVLSESISLSLPICFEKSAVYNYYPSEYDDKINFIESEINTEITLNIFCDNQNKFAA